MLSAFCICVYFKSDAKLRLLLTISKDFAFFLSSSRQKAPHSACAARRQRAIRTLFPFRTHPFSISNAVVFHFERSRFPFAPHALSS